MVPSQKTAAGSVEEAAAVVVKNNYDDAVAIFDAVDAAAVEEKIAISAAVVELPHVDIERARVLTLPQECRAASHNSRRQRSL